MELRKHQIELINKAREEIINGIKKLLVFAPCSFGKTIFAAEISRLAVEKGKKILFIVHRRLLCTQTKEKFDAYGLHNSIIMAGYETDFTAPVMITTVQTYTRRLDLDDPQVNKFFHDAKIIFTDEAHLGISPGYKKIYSFYENEVLIGLTGSPARGDQRGLGEVFEKIIASIGIQELTDQGWLAPVRYFAASAPDLSDVKIVQGDYHKGQLQKKMNTEILNGDIIDNWLRIAQNRPTIIFTSGVKHSINLAEKFNKVGIPTAHLDSHSTHEQREKVLYDFRQGVYTVITNCMLFTEGYDADFVGCIGIARATKSFPLWVQMAGRGQRIFDGKADCLLMDFGGNIERHGFLTDEVEWTLDGKEKAWHKVKKEREPVKIKCQACNFIFEGKTECPECGSPIKTYGKVIQCLDLDLQEVKEPKEKHTMLEKRLYWGMIQYWVREKGKSEKMAYAKYKTRFGVWPDNSIRYCEPIKPDQAFLNLMKHDIIKWVKGKKIAESQAKLDRGGELIEQCKLGLQGN